METAPCCGPKPPSDQSADRDALGLLHRAASLTMVMCPRGPGANQVVGGGGAGGTGLGRAIRAADAEDTRCGETATRKKPRCGPAGKRGCELGKPGCMSKEAGSGTVRLTGCEGTGCSPGCGHGRGEGAGVGPQGRRRQGRGWNAGFGLRPWVPGEVK